MRNKNILIVFSLLTCLLLSVFFLVKQVYPWILIGLYFVAVLSLVVAFIPWLQLKEKILKHTTEIEVVFVLLLLSLGVRLYRVEQVTPGMWGDEITVAQMSVTLHKQQTFVPFVPTNYGHPTPLLYGTMLTIGVMGKSFTSIRLISIVFGVLATIIFYILLRQLFPVPIAAATSILFSLSYGNIIVSRLAHEITASLFFQILSYIFLYAYWKTKKHSYLALLGISLGFGLWTYVAFRLIVLGIFLLTGFLIWKKEGSKKILSSIGVVCVLMGIAVAPLLTYFVHHPQDVTSRINSVSVFNKGLAPQELVKEVMGGAARSLSVLVGGADHNPRQNPSTKPLFDYGSFVLLYLGLFVLSKKKNRKRLAVWVVLLVPLLLNDILATEFIPEFHYYGIGHPNTLRIVGILPVIFVSVGYGIQEFGSIITSKIIKKKIPVWLLYGCMTVPLVLINLLWYFQQPDGVFVYVTNGVREYNATQYINSLGKDHVLVSPSIRNDPRFQFFISPKISVDDFVSSASSAAQLKIPDGMTVILDPSQNMALANSIIRDLDTDNPTIHGGFLSNPAGQVDTLIFSR